MRLEEAAHWFETLTADDYEREFGRSDLDDEDRADLCRNNPEWCGVGVFAAGVNALGDGRLDHDSHSESEAGGVGENFFFEPSLHEDVRNVEKLVSVGKVRALTPEELEAGLRSLIARIVWTVGGPKWQYLDDDMKSVGITAAWEAKDKFRGEGTFGKYCAVVVHHALIDFIRKELRESLLLGAPRNPHAPRASTGDVAGLRTA